MDSLCFRASPGLVGMPFQASAAAGVGETLAASRRSYMQPRPPKMMQPRGGGSVERGNKELAGLQEERGRREHEREAAPSSRHRRGNWVFKILRRGRRSGVGVNDDQIFDDGERCSSCQVGGGEGEVKLDRDSFRRMLRRVSLPEARLFGRLSYLGRLAYNIPRIKSEDLVKCHRLSFVTSSLENKPEIPTPEDVNSSLKDQEIQMPEEEKEAEEEEEKAEEEEEEKEEGEKVESQLMSGLLLSPSSAYRIAASAASYLQSQTRTILPFKPARTEMVTSSSTGSTREEDEMEPTSSSVASFVATTSSVTAVVAAKEETKLAIANDLNSSASSPCEWYICDDDSIGTRFFIIQGSDSIASWKANLLFEPVRFEGLDVLVHRGIYEAAKGIYQQLLTEVRNHLNARGTSATLRFTGHSLGAVPPSCLLPVVTFGSPYIMCGGDYLLQKLGLPLNHVQAIAMHRDIVPRAFSCSYPDYVAEILKALNGKFRDHPCLKNKRRVFSTPPPSSSRQRPLLLAGDHQRTLLAAAQSLFLNSPHPLEILSDRAAYGFEGTIYRDHDVHAYVRSIRAVIRRELDSDRKARSERRRRRRTWWPLVGLGGSTAGSSSASPSWWRAEGSR
ncbi:unnamed protein product [Spirodela intermedia]|uniref:Fungal lipase-type domain-containing protein n=1 Tax=Spirodela intermedia TaxID=51605 RepID=A0A7I8IW03_SPIIN|nr:unnamed protein product [Spirodela intermedia]CAA6661989.1 unnamed protein product [Spirodela intermedia]